MSRFRPMDFCISLDSCQKMRFARSKIVIQTGRRTVELLLYLPLEVYVENRKKNADSPATLSNMSHNIFHPSISAPRSGSTAQEAKEDGDWRCAATPEPCLVAVTLLRTRVTSLPHHYVSSTVVL